MTGYGEGEATGISVSVNAEVRAVNNRYLKINFRSNERVGKDETWAEKIVRQYIKRGTVHVQLQTVTEDQRNRFHINAETLNAYREELQEFQRHHPMGLALRRGLPSVGRRSRKKHPCPFRRQSRQHRRHSSKIVL